MPHQFLAANYINEHLQAKVKEEYIKFGTLEIDNIIIPPQTLEVLK